VEEGVQIENGVVLIVKEVEQKVEGVQRVEVEVQIVGRVDPIMEVEVQKVVEEVQRIEGVVHPVEVVVLVMVVVAQ